MPLDENNTFGVCYLSVDEFKEASGMFGIASLPDDPVIKAQLAAASRWVEAICNRKFVPDQEFEEQHDWDPVSRRVAVNNPPVLEVISYKIYTGVGTFSTFGTNALVLNSQQNYVELASLAAAGNMTSALLSLGLTQPYVLIKYKSLASVKPNIKLATGYLAATLMNRAHVEANFPAGLRSMSVGGGASVTRAEGKSMEEVPQMAKILLAGEQEITIC